MILSRRKIVGLGINALLAVGGLEAWKFISKNTRFFTVVFTTQYPEGKRSEDFFEDQLQFFHQKNKNIVDIHENLSHLVVSQKTLKSSRSHQKIITFRNKEDYIQWEKNLSSLKLFNQDALKNLGYKMQTFFYS